MFESEIQLHTGQLDCPCPACTGSVDPFLYVEDASVDPLAPGVGDNGKPIWTPEAIAAHLNRTGAGWNGLPGQAPQSDTDLAEITFGFHTSQQSLWDNGYVYEFNGGLYGFSEYFNFATFSEAQKAAVREAMENWGDVIVTTLVETADVNAADITFGNLASAPTTQAYAYLPRSPLTSNAYINAQIQDLAGDVWVSLSQASNLQLDEGRYGLQTLVHEIGHSLGLSHPGSYNAAPGVSITYPVNAEYYQDTRAYTVMSYFNANVIGARHFDFHLSTTAYAGTPLIHDILAAQRIYGADMTTRTGDTTYGFNSNAGRDSYDFVKTPAPILAIWDAGGIDTLDASGYATNQIIDLREGALSSIGGVTLADAPTYEQVLANRAAIGGFAALPQATYDANMAALAANAAVGTLTDNVGIAYGTVIENGIGGSGNDLLVGNAADNLLKGNAGGDGLSGGDGKDRLEGGDGDDILIGGDGVDSMIGGAGFDRFVAEINATKSSSKDGPISLDLIFDFKKGEDKIDVSGIDAKFATAGHQAFKWDGSSSGKQAGDLSYKVFDSVNGAEKALGMELDGVAGPNSPFAGKVTVVFGNVDGGAQDFAYVLFGVDAVAVSDFII